MDKTLTVILALLVPLGWGLLSAWAFDGPACVRSCPNRHDNGLGGGRVIILAPCSWAHSSACSPVCSV